MGLYRLVVAPHHREETAQQGTLPLNHISWVITCFLHTPLLQDYISNSIRICKEVA
ncbi:unnamed protein product [Brassica oleracea]